MTETAGAAAIENASIYRQEIDPLLLYESQVTSGQEFRAYVPQGEEHRQRASRHEKTLLKTWRGVPTEKCSIQSRNLKQGLSSIKDLECRHVETNERTFAVVLAAVLIILGAIFAVIAMNLHF